MSWVDWLDDEADLVRAAAGKGRAIGDGRYPSFDGRGEDTVTRPCVEVIRLVEREADRGLADARASGNIVDASSGHRYPTMHPTARTIRSRRLR